MFNLIKSREIDLELSDLDRILLSREQNKEIKPVPIFTKAVTVSKDAGRNFVRLNNSFLAKKNGIFSRNQPVVVINRNTGDKIFGYVRGCPTDVNLDRHTVGLEYDSYQSLGLTNSGHENLEVKPASFFDALTWQWYHLDQGIRLAIRIAVIGFGFEIVGTILQLLQFFI